MTSFGEMLRRERELRGVSLREIADSTKISVRFLQALETDRLDVLPGGVFRRAFVKQYARHLGLDAERLVAEFVYAHGEQAQEQPRAGNGRDRSNPGTLFLIAVFGAAAVLSLWKAAPERQAQEPAAAAAAVAASGRARPILVPATAPQPAPDPGLVLTLQARQSCWVEARVDGQIVLNRVLEEGQAETIEARGEIVLSLGNAGGITFTLNEQPGLPLGKPGEVRRNIVITPQSLPTLVEAATQLRAAHSS